MTALNTPLTHGTERAFARGMVAGLLASLVLAIALAVALLAGGVLAVPAAPAVPAIDNPAPAVQVDAENPHTNGPIVAY